jgi:thiamine-phosphate pyrophosphorylase
MSRQEHAVYRLLDANINRVVEGIRVVEDASRMLLDDTDATVRLKAMRHDLTSVVARDPALDRSLLNARSSETDILRDDLGESHIRRPDTATVVRANISRAQEALRAIEEYAKLISSELSATAKRIRFSLYDMEPDVLTRLRFQPFANGDALRIAVEFGIFSSANGDTIAASVPSLAVSGVNRLVIRADECSDGDFAHSVKPLVTLCRANGMVLSVANRLDLALSSGADGVELASDGLAPEDCRSVAGNGFAVGLRFSENTVRDDIPYASYDYCVADETGIGTLRSRGAARVVVRYQATEHTRVPDCDIGADGVTIIADTEQIDLIRDCIGAYAALNTTCANTHDPKK